MDQQNQIPREQQVPIPPLNPPTVTSHFNWKLYIPVILVIVTVFLAVGWMVSRSIFQKPDGVNFPAKQTSNAQISLPTSKSSSWKTYNNAQYSFSYPEEWGLVDSNGSQRIFVDKQAAALDGPDHIVVVGEFDKDILKIGFGDPVGTRREIADQVFLEKVSTLTVDGFSAFKTTSDVLPGSQTDSIPGIGVVIDIGEFRVLGISMTLDQPTSDPAIFERIVSTFRFVK